MFAMMGRRREDEEGSSLIETALSSSIVLALIFGILQMSLALYSYDCVCEAAREGSRYAMVRGSTSCINTSKLTNCGVSADQVQAYVQSLGFPGLNSAAYMHVYTIWLGASAAKPTSWVDCSPAVCNAPGNLVQVEVTYQFPLSIPFWHSTVLSLRSTSQMAIAQ
jgi:Flp pilus assembly protein TadG